MVQLAGLHHIENASFFQQPADFYHEKACLMEAAVWAAGWDGAWFRRAYDDICDPVGSVVNSEGQIFIEPQGMCIIAGLGVEDGKAQTALDSVAEHWQPARHCHFTAAYTHYDLKLGEISTYRLVTRKRRNFLSHNPWIMIAETRIGRGERAFDYYSRICPSAREQISEVHRCEPYVYAQMIAGKDAATHGEAKNSWLTGTASWNFAAITQHILGIRPTYSGLCVQPVIPEAWQGFRRCASSAERAI